MSADTSAIHFGSDHTRVGIFYAANTSDPAPCLLLLHGIPGSEKNHDLAHFLRANGWHVLVLHFSGSWGSGGSYNPLDQITDTQLALDYLLSDACPRPVDPEKIVVLGYSLGSRAALLTAAENERIVAVISLSGYADFSEILVDASRFEGSVPLLTNVTAEDIARYYGKMGNGLQPYEVPALIALRPVLVIHGTADEVVMHFNASAFTGDNVQTVLIDGANHTFADHRQQLIEAVWEFLRGIYP